MNNNATSQINRLERFYCAPDWSWETAGSSRWTNPVGQAVAYNFDFWTVLQGSGTLTARGQAHGFQAGDCFILRGDQSYRVSHNPEDPLVIFAVHYDYLDNAGKVIVPPTTRLHRRIEHLEFFTHMLERMESAWHEDHPDDANAWLKVCLLEIDRQDRQLAQHGHVRKQADKIQQLCKKIRRHPERKWAVEKMAESLNCSRFHFTRLFKQMMGQPPQAFITTVRINAAKGLLHSSCYSIGRIAELLGYRDIYFFSRHFKKITGLSPSHYRKKG